VAKPLQALVLGVAVIHCGAKDPTPVQPLSLNPYYALRLNIRYAVMSTASPYDTLQLVATPYDGSGAVLSTTATPVFSTTDDSVISVTPSGFVHALKATSTAYVTVRLQDPVSYVTHTDTAVIAITDDAPASPLTTFAIQPLPGDSARLAAGNQFFPVDTLAVRATDADGTDITSNLFIRYASSNATVASVDPVSGVVAGLKVGTATITATTTYYGVTKRDSVMLTIVNPILATVSLTPVSTASDGSPLWGFSPHTITVGVGGTVAFAFDYGPTARGILDVVFDDPSAARPSQLPPMIVTALPDSGNIAAIRQPPNDSTVAECMDLVNYPDYGFFKCRAARAFYTPGTYHYHSARYGTTGTIIVK
jgi:hypothetical protein